ncbi:hypothetical protein CONPUDRAFT_84308, partial [Coniophora puteana RWD-64-598 SS2]
MSQCQVCHESLPKYLVEGDQASKVHLCCAICNRRFFNVTSLQTHYILSSHHHYCSMCAKDFKNEGGLKLHRQYALAHRSESQGEFDDEYPPVG